MKPVVSFAVFTLLVAACASSKPHAPSNPSELEPAGPPPASARTGDGFRPLSYGDWASGATDSGAAAFSLVSACSDSSVPKIEVQRGQPVAFLIEFDPKSVRLAVGKSYSKKLLSVREPKWKASRAGSMLLHVRGTLGRVDYAGCLRFTQGS
jgi:hypothetical protein